MTQDSNTRASEAMREALPDRIGSLCLGERFSDGERLCMHSHPVAAGHPLYWPEQMGSNDDSDPYCLAHAIERTEDEQRGFGDPFPQDRAGDEVQIPEGMKRWDGGDSAPEDWDGRRGMIRSGELFDYADGRHCVWRHTGKHRDIIAYTPKPTPAPASVRADALEEAARVVRAAQASYTREAQGVFGGPWKRGCEHTAEELGMVAHKLERLIEAARALTAPTQ